MGSSGAPGRRHSPGADAGGAGRRLPLAVRTPAALLCGAGPRALPDRDLLAARPQVLPATPGARPGPGAARAGHDVPGQPILVRRGDLDGVRRLRSAGGRDPDCAAGDRRRRPRPDRAARGAADALRPRRRAAADAGARQPVHPGVHGAGRAADQVRRPARAGRGLSGGHRADRGGSADRRLGLRAAGQPGRTQLRRRAWRARQGARPAWTSASTRA